MKLIPIAMDQPLSEKIAFFLLFIGTQIIYLSMAVLFEMFAFRGKLRGANVCGMWKSPNLQELGYHVPAIDIHSCVKEKNSATLHTWMKCRVRWGFVMFIVRCPVSTVHGSACPPVHKMQTLQLSFLVFTLKCTWMIYKSIRWSFHFVELRCICN